jgi:hypothetical protein
VDEIPWVVSLIVAWAPFLLFLGALMWSGRQLRKCMMTADGRTLADAFSDLAREMRRANDLKAPPAA